MVSIEYTKSEILPKPLDIFGSNFSYILNLLITTVWSRISEELGFVNSSSFTRWFVKSEGLSPQKYRLLNKG